MSLYRGRFTSFSHCSWLSVLQAVTAFFLGVALPTSSAITNISLGLLLVCLLFQPWRGTTQRVFSVVKHPLVWIPAMLFFLLFLSLFILPNDGGEDIVGKYRKLLYIAPLTLFFLSNKKLIRYLVSGFLWANAFILIVTSAVGFTKLKLWGINPADPTLFELHITQSFFISLTALIWLSRAFKEGTRVLARYGYLFLTILSIINVLLLVKGRTGYLALLVGILVWGLMAFNKKHLMLLVSGMGVAILLFILIPNRAVEQLSLGVVEIKTCMAQRAPEICDTSMGLRTSFIRDSLALVKKAPWFGYGANGFKYRNATYPGANNPHNEYLMITVQTGLVGLSFFLAWMFFCYRSAWQLPSARRNLLIAWLSSYAACNFFNSFLLDFAEGHVFIIFVAVLATLSIRSSRKLPENNDYNRHALTD